MLLKRLLNLPIAPWKPSVTMRLKPRLTCLKNVVVTLPSKVRCGAKAYYLSTHWTTWRKVVVTTLRLIAAIPSTGTRYAIAYKKLVCVIPTPWPLRLLQPSQTSVVSASPSNRPTRIYLLNPTCLVSSPWSMPT